MQKHLDFLPSIQDDESFRGKKGIITKEESKKHPTLTLIFSFSNLYSISPSRGLSGLGPNGSLALIWSSVFIKYFSYSPHFKGIWKSSTYSAWGQLSKSQFKLFLNPFSFDHFLSHYQIPYIDNMKNQKRRQRFIVNTSQPTANF